MPTFWCAQVGYYIYMEKYVNLQNEHVPPTTSNIVLYRIELLKINKSVIACNQEKAYGI
jgi:hypothetical protein